MNQLSLSLRTTASVALDWSVERFTVPEPGVPSSASGGWIVDTSNAADRAGRRLRALVYSAIQNHPLEARPRRPDPRLRRAAVENLYEFLLREPYRSSWFGSPGTL